MPLLTYSYPNFTPNTVIQSSQVNAKFQDIKTLLNTTKLDDSNLQDAGITRSTKLKAGTASVLLQNDATGKMSELLTPLDTARGGTGQNLSPSPSDVGKTLQIDASGNIVLGNAAQDLASKLYLFNRIF